VANANHTTAQTFLFPHCSPQQSTFLEPQRDAHTGYDWINIHVHN